MKRGTSTGAEAPAGRRRCSPELRLKLRSLDERPLTAADLQQEIDYLRPLGLRLRVFTSRG